MRRIESNDDLIEGMAHLSTSCAVMKRMCAQFKMPPLRRSEAGFAGLARIVLAQQISVAAADSIEKQLEKALKGFTPNKILKSSDEMIRSCGVSRPKINTLRALAQAVVDKSLDLKALEHLTPEQAREELTKVCGIGPWTADIYLMFCLGDADSFAPGDLALQEAVKVAFNMRKRPDVKRLEKHARKWSPWRGVAARLLWMAYAHTRDAAKKSKSVSLPCIL